MYYVYKIEYSQTDSDIVIIYSKDQNPAPILKRRYPKARYYHLEYKTSNFHNN